MEKMKVRLSAFEGPMDLLCHLIEKNEIDIYDIPIAVLTQQYLQFLEEGKDPDMDDMSEFLLMAATLLEIKSRLLLPKPKKETEEEVDPREELVARLLEYKKYKEVTQIFRDLQEEAGQILYKEADSTLALLREREDNQDMDAFLKGVGLEDLYTAFLGVMERKAVKVDKVRSGFRHVERDLFTVKEKMDYIKDLLELTPKVSFGDIFREDVQKIEVVVTFLALLELIKLREIQVSQAGVFGEILLQKGEGDEVA